MRGFVVLDFVFPYQARLGNISEMTCFVSSETLNLNSVNQSTYVNDNPCWHWYVWNVLVIGRAVGATIVNRTEELKEEDVGTECGLFEIEKIGDE